MEDEKKIPNTIGTQVVVIQPERIEVPLVPLDQLDTAEDKYLWFTIFIAIASCASGIAFSAFDPTNSLHSSRWIFIVICVLFWTLSLVFGIQALKKRKFMRASATKETAPDARISEEEESVPKKLRDLVLSTQDEKEVFALFMFLFDRYGRNAVPIAIDFVCKDDSEKAHVNEHVTMLEYLSQRIEEALGMRMWFGGDEDGSKFKRWCEHAKQYGIPKRSLQDLQKLALLQR